MNGTASTASIPAAAAERPIGEASPAQRSSTVGMPVNQTRPMMPSCLPILTFC